ncbi:Family of unknown function [Prevotella sp. KH2C16]|nr:Family of unknown function [Prevotella sp. KH2C16]
MWHIFLPLRKFKHIILGIVWTIAGLYLLLVLLTHLPPVQHFIAVQVSNSLARKLGTAVNIGRVDIGFLNRFIIDDFLIKDQKGYQMLKATRLSAKVDLLPFIQGRVSISSVQLFGLQANLYKETEKEDSNFQFLIDSLASKDTTVHTPLDLAINSLIIRNGKLKYNELYTTESPNTLSLQHIDIKDISAHLILNVLRDDSLNLNVNKMAFKEVKGMDVNLLKFKLIANKTKAELANFRLELPNSWLRADLITANYAFNNNDKLELPSLTYQGEIAGSEIALCDFSSLDYSLKGFKTPFNLSSSFSGTSTSLRVKNIEVESQNRDFRLQANGSISHWGNNPRWNVSVGNLSISSDGLNMIAENFRKKINLPKELTRIGSLKYRGEIGGFDKNLSVNGILVTDVGSANLALGKHGTTFNGHIETDGIRLSKVLPDDDFGLIATNLDVKGILNAKSIPSLTANGTIQRFDYKGYSYKNLTINGTLLNGLFNGALGIDDPNGKIDLQGSFNTNSSNSYTKITAQVRRLNPSALKFTNQYPGTIFSFDTNIDLTGKSLNSLDGIISIRNFSMESRENAYSLSSLTIRSSSDGNGRQIEMTSDFGNVQMYGKFDYASIGGSVADLIGNRLPTLPGLPTNIPKHDNRFSINATIIRSDWLNKLLDIPLELNEPAHIEGYINDSEKKVNLVFRMPRFVYRGNLYEQGYLDINSPNDTLIANVKFRQMSKIGGFTNWVIKASAADNKLATLLSFQNKGDLDYAGILDTQTQFFRNERNEPAAHIMVHTSDINVGDSIWTINPSDIVYSKNRAIIDHFAIEHNSQHVIVSGIATKSIKDTVGIDLQGVDVNYVLNLLNFHSVEFGGKATGHAYLSGVFENPEAHANLMVSDFTFEDGRMGILSADVNLNNRERQIDIDGIAYDEDNSRTLIKGYVSPQKNYIDLGIKAQNTRCEFLEGFCGSFMRDVNVHANGACRVIGALDEVNLTGKLVANGTVGITPLNTVYILKNDTITMIPNEIVFSNDSILDHRGHYGVVNGALHHKALTNLTYDLNLSVDNLLAYDFHEFGSDSFYGTVYATGTCDIAGRSGSLDFNINATPEKGSFIVYNAASPAAISNQTFIHWRDRNDSLQIDSVGENRPLQSESTAISIPTDIHLNFLINSNPNLNLRVLMDQESGDMISLYGKGAIRATYYNKGAFDMFGNYDVDYGTYKLTIQNVISRNFEFQEGSRIVFGGDAYNAALNLKAKYTVNGVSLADLNIGRSFSNNNIRVNCLMNITGTPASPQIDFGLDLPTVNSEAKQMVMNLINSEEEMNQQVLYLLAIGRFYSQGNNNAVAEGTSTQQSETSLAMQSILSGQLSQQLNNVLKSVVNNSNWNLGANISTGTEGFNNAEYEGILSGHLLNNRLLFNGQFGYRDNANATTSFIGDFDLRYLIVPNGDFAIRVYNQTNDRYFTRNSLNTQGLGFIIKKDFSNWKDLWGISRKKKQNPRIK